MQKNVCESHLQDLPLLDFIDDAWPTKNSDVIVGYVLCE